MPVISEEGTYRGVLMESSVGVTKRGFPQLIAKLSATERYVQHPDDLARFELTEPGWVDWSEYDESITSYMVLFIKDPDVFNCDKSDTENYNGSFLYEMLQDALGWEGQEFESLDDGSLEGSKVLFVLSENEFNGKINLQVNRMAKFDADPVSSLRKLDKESLSSLTAKLRGARSKPKVAAKKKTAKKKAKSAPKAAPKSAPGKIVLVGCTKDAAWKAILAGDHGRNDAEVENAWVDAVEALGDDRDDEDITETEWAGVRGSVLKTLNSLTD